MVKNLIPQKEWILQLRLMDSKIFYLTKKYSDFKNSRIQGKKHKMATYEINKISLFVFGDKRFALNDDTHTLAYFHKDLKNHGWSQIKISAYK